MVIASLVDMFDRSRYLFSHLVPFAKPYIPTRSSVTSLVGGFAIVGISPSPDHDRRGLRFFSQGQIAVTDTSRSPTPTTNHRPTDPPCQPPVPINEDGYGSAR